MRKTKKIIGILIVLLTLFISTTLVVACHARKPREYLYERYTTGDWKAEEIYGNIYYAGQTFTVKDSHYLTKASLKLQRIGNPGTVKVFVTTFNINFDWFFKVVSIGSINERAITTSINGSWIDIPLSPCKLLSGHTYAIFVKALNGNENNKVLWRADEEYYDEDTGYHNTGYTGEYCGSIWNNQWTPDAIWGQGWFANRDFMFKEYGRRI